ncbi:transcription initiation factor TFIID subunit 1-like [Ostrea edulis]|uniref:transcription initiation factor TFIID subunit 1-like n=1 Tax=Ostrea edulis TaxID=37623 RepID=UPI0024AEF424|nr:transcription initiation factor TFIID subunit 1-like [Ostrea edulis]
MVEGYPPYIRDNDTLKSLCESVGIVSINPTHMCNSKNMGGKESKDDVDGKQTETKVRGQSVRGAIQGQSVRVSSEETENFTKRGERAQDLSVGKEKENISIKEGIWFSEADVVDLDIEDDNQREVRSQVRHTKDDIQTRSQVRDTEDDNQREVRSQVCHTKDDIQTRSQVCHTEDDNQREVRSQVCDETVEQVEGYSGMYTASEDTGDLNSPSQMYIASEDLTDDTPQLEEVTCSECRGDVDSWDKQESQTMCSCSGSKPFNVFNDNNNHTDNVSPCRTCSAEVDRPKLSINTKDCIQKHCPKCENSQQTYSNNNSQQNHSNNNSSQQTYSNNNSQQTYSNNNSQQTYSCHAIIHEPLKGSYGHEPVAGSVTEPLKGSFGHEPVAGSVTCSQCGEQSGKLTSVFDADFCENCYKEFEMNVSVACSLETSKRTGSGQIKVAEQQFADKGYMNPELLVKADDDCESWVSSRNSESQSLGSSAEELEVEKTLPPADVEESGEVDENGDIYGAVNGDEVFDDTLEASTMIQTYDGVQWEGNFMCTCEDCLKGLRIERIMTADKSTMCPEDPPYILMCEICEE